MAGRNSAYARVQWRGHTFNQRTVAFLEQSERVFHLIGGEGNFDVLQGSYSGGVEQSGGTHDGGGAVDFWVPGPQSNWDKAIRAQRICGGAAYDRPNTSSWNHHGHTLVIGDREMSEAARRQVQDYYAGLNALSNHAPDPTWRPNPIPVFSYPLVPVRLSVVRTEAKKRSGWESRPSVRRVQRALNAKTGTTLVADGIFGPKTRAAYARLERQVGGDGDGLPATFTLTLLGAARFNVRP